MRHETWRGVAFDGSGTESCSRESLAEVRRVYTRYPKPQSRERRGSGGAQFVQVVWSGVKQDLCPSSGQQIVW